MQTRINKRISQELSENHKIKGCALTFGVTGDETRLKICYLLCHYPELSVSEIAAAIDAPISTVSHSLAKLRFVNVVQNRREAKMVYYSLMESPFTHILKAHLAT